MDKTDVLRSVKAELDVKVIMAATSEDAHLRGICEKIWRIQRETNETVMHRSLFGKDDQNRPHFTTEQLEKLHDDLKDHGTNSYNRIRELTKLLFKTEMDVIAQKKNPWMHWRSTKKVLLTFLWYMHVTISTSKQMVI